LTAARARVTVALIDNLFHLEGNRTRTLGDLRTRGLLATVGNGDSERFCLHEPEGAHHGQLAVSH